MFFFFKKKRPKTNTHVEKKEFMSVKNDARICLHPWPALFHPPKKKQKNQIKDYVTKFLVAVFFFKKKTF